MKYSLLNSSEVWVSWAVPTQNISLPLVFFFLFLLGNHDLEILDYVLVFKKVNNYIISLGHRIT